MEKVVKTAHVQLVKGTMTIHQLTTSRKLEGTVFHRELSCFCSLVELDGFCACHSRKQFQVKQETQAVLSRLENKLGTEVVSKFQKRLIEGYDAALRDLGPLDEQTRNKYINWKAWRAAKLQHAENNNRVYHANSELDHHEPTLDFQLR